MMAGVKAGGNRQELHEKVRLHCQAAAAQVKQFGRANDLIGRLKADVSFVKVNLDKLLEPKAYIGIAPQQVDEFIRNVVNPIRRRYRKQISRKVNLQV